VTALLVFARLAFGGTSPCFAFGYTSPCFAFGCASPYLATLKRKWQISPSWTW